MFPSEMTALLVCKPGPLQEGLSDILSAMPKVKLLEPIGDFNDSIKIMITQHPDLILIDTHLTPPQGTYGLVAEIKTTCPGSICIVVAGDMEQKNIALEAGADNVQITGCPADELYQAIRHLIDTRTDRC